MCQKDTKEAVAAEQQACMAICKTLEEKYTNLRDEAKSNGDSEWEEIFLNAVVAICEVSQKIRERME